MSLFTALRRDLTAWTYAFGPARHYQSAYRFIVADVGVSRGAWLDIGCGPGWLCARAAAGNPELDVVGIDTSPKMVELARRNKGGLLNVTIREMDAAQIVYPEGTFDVVTAVQSAHHWKEPARIFAEAWRVLVPGGKLYVYEADPDGEIPDGWIDRGGGWPPDRVLRLRWRRNGMDAARFAALREIAEASPFSGDVAEERHGFYRRLVCTR